jgi:hypothetical protein
MERAAGLGTEVSLILKSDIFERAPTQARLLMYLYRHRVDRGGCATQTDIATEGLGRSDFDETTDSSIRVQVSRLRKSLADYYLTNAPHDGLCVYIKRGEYRLRSARVEIAYPELAAHANASAGASSMATAQPEQAAPVPASAVPTALGSNLAIGTSSAAATSNYAHDVAAPLDIAPSPEGSAHSSPPLAASRRFPFRRPFFIAAAVAAILAGVIVFDQLDEPVIASPSPTALQVPTVGLEVETAGDIPALGGQRLSELLRADIDTLLQKSMISRVLPEQSQIDRDFYLDIRLRQTRGDAVMAFVSLRDRRGVVLSEESLATSIDFEEVREGVFDEVVSLVSPSGVISRNLAEQIPSVPRNGFECFLATENARAIGAGSEDTLTYCLRNYREDEFWPFFASRQAFVDIQAKIVAGKDVSSRSPEWNSIAAILEQYPENPYANTIAAKLLISEDRCLDARGYALEGFSRGRSYPALELSILVDAYGCSNASDNRAFRDQRIRRIYLANRDPHALLETYLLLGAIVSDQTDILDEERGRTFSARDETPLDDLNEALRRAIEGRARPADYGRIETGVPSVIFNHSTRDLIFEKLGYREAN